MRGLDIRLALLTPFSSSQYIGGVEVFNTQLEMALGPAEVFAGERPTSAPPRVLNRIGLRQPHEAYRATLAFLRSHRCDPYDLVITNGLYGWPLAIKRLSVPVIQVYHFTMAGLGRRALELPGDRFTTGVVSAFFDGLAGRGKHVVAVSPLVLDEVRVYYRLSGTVITNAVDTERFRGGDAREARRALGIPREGVTGLFVGRQEFAKGFDIVAEVSRLLPNVNFLFVGPIQYSARNVRVLRDIPHDKMPLCYSAADFFLLPSRYEGFNLAVLEALASNLPIVVSQASYTLSTSPDLCGRVVYENRAEAYVEAIKAVLDNPDSFAPRQLAVEEHSLVSFRERWLEFTRPLVEGG